MSLEFLTTREVSDLCGVHVSSIKRWIRIGILKAFRTAGGHMRIPAREIHAFLRSQGMPVPQSLVNIAREAFETGEVESPKAKAQGRLAEDRRQKVEGSINQVNQNPPKADQENPPPAKFESEPDEASERTSGRRREGAGSHDEHHGTAEHSALNTLHSTTKVLVLGDGDELAAYVREEGLSDRVFIERASGFVDAGVKIALFRPGIVLVKSDGPGRSAGDLKAEVDKAGLGFGVRIFEFRDRASAMRILRGIQAR